MISFIIPTRNNLPYLKLAYGSIRRFYPEYEVIILDDNSTDGTKEWLDELIIKDKNTIRFGHTGKQVVIRFFMILELEFHTMKFLLSSMRIWYADQTMLKTF